MDPHAPTALLVDDHDAFQHQLAKVFDPADQSNSPTPPTGGVRFKYVKTPEDAARLLQKGWTPDYAFVDFHFKDRQQTGLVVMGELAAHSPGTVKVVLTTLDEKGRGLYAVASYRWFGVKLIVDKSCDHRTFAAIVNGENVTPPAWQIKLERHAGLLDDLFQEPTWAAIWATWPDTRGNERAILDKVPGVTKPAINKFKNNATEAIAEYRKIFGATMVHVERGNKERLLPITEFAKNNETFFQAPELPAILDVAKPWNKR